MVGAGPVGLMAALRLREQGVDVRVIDEQTEHGLHTFPVVLHPATVRLLGSLGLTDALFWRGRPVSHLAVYTDGARRAVLDLPQAAGISPGALTMPQDSLRQALTDSLRGQGVAIEWNTRLASLQQDENAARGWLEAQVPGQGSTFEADFVIGADGYDSAVRRGLGIELVEHGPLQTYAFFDATSSRAGTEAQLAISEAHASAFYPIQGGVGRFSFQLTSALDRPADLAALSELIAARMPWHQEQVQTCEWGGVAEFRHALATNFGVGRVWLAGEAAHLTGPLGVQSLNVGLDEASDLALRIGDALRHPERRSLGDYDVARAIQWHELLGLSERASLGPRSPAWASRHLRRIVSCLPASGRDLDDLLDQLRLTPSARPQAG
ncbi:MAG: monooxygenase FAD-binding protein [Polyangiaceae bacterium]|nr:monooxygenase FAD-binding protein [Polyangiaceae bacterium]